MRRLLGTEGLRGAAAALLVSALAVACGGGDDGGGRVVVLGFDGMDYGLTRKMIDEGRLPSFARLEKMGLFQKLETSVPPESPVAWSNFTTGMDAGGHGIFDFVHRDPKTLFPYPADREIAPEGFTLELGKWQFPITGGGLVSLRHGTPFWQVLEDHGIESWVLRMPANFPVSERATRELSGMGTDDVRGTPGFFSYYTSELFYPGDHLTGGEAFEWDVYDGVAEQKLYGPDNPLLRKPERLAVDFELDLDKDEPLAELRVGDEVRVLRVGEFSDWVPIEFEMMPTQTLHGMARFYLKSIQPELELYVSPINFDPMSPDAPIANPLSFATDLAEATGRFYTQGMPEDTKSVTDDVMSVDFFVKQARIASSEIREQYKWVLDQFHHGLLFYYLGNPDQVSHVMWASMDPGHPAYSKKVFGKYADLIPSIYEGLDEMVGYTLDRLSPDDLLIVMSDHGFASWRRTFNINSWLVANGYMTLKNPKLEKDPGLFQNVDWSKTKAYGMGINGLYVNLEGRERNGIVAPRDRDALLEELEQKLLATIDPKTGAPAVAKVFKREETYHFTDHIAIGPDIQMGFAKGYRGSGKGALGEIEPEFLFDNTDDWTGDHIMDPDTVPGVLFASRKLHKPATSLTNLASSILAELGIDDPDEFPRQSD